MGEPKVEYEVKRKFVAKPDDKRPVMTLTQVALRLIQAGAERKEKRVA